jgi:two-component system LytT family sensor kinase
LTENAIKHGITSLPDGGEIKIKVESSGNTLLIQVINSGRLKGENLKGIGLKNIREGWYICLEKQLTFIYKTI